MGFNEAMEKIELKSTRSISRVKRNSLKLGKTISDLVTKKRQSLFLKELSNTGNLTHSLASQKIPKRLLKTLRKNTTFERRYNDALERASDRLEAAAVQLAIGNKVPVYGKLPGRDSGSGIVGYKIEYDSGMLQFLLRANKPEKFGTVGAKHLNVNQVNVSLSDRLRKARRILQENEKVIDV